MKKINGVKIIAILVVVMLATLWGVRITKKETNKGIIATGLNKGQNEYFQSKLAEADAFYNLIRKGKMLRQQERYEEAIKHFKEMYDKEHNKGGKKGMMVSLLADTYEEMKDYKNALKFVEMNRDEFVNDWAKAPVVERAKYLKYALEGNYEMAVVQAEKTLEAELNMPYNETRVKPGQRYMDRLNDIKASKEYIESLKE
jgi:tetratricopeptide (TPR) repeat protein